MLCCNIFEPLICNEVPNYNSHIFVALRKMRKLDHVASKIGRNSIKRCRNRHSYKIPTSIYKLKHLIMRPKDDEEEKENKSFGRTKALKNDDDFLNQPGINK